MTQSLIVTGFILSTLLCKGDRFLPQRTKQSPDSPQKKSDRFYKNPKLFQQTLIKATNGDGSQSKVAFLV